MEVAEGPLGGPTAPAAGPSPSPVAAPQPRLASKVVVPSPHAYDPR